MGEKHYIYFYFLRSRMRRRHRVIPMDGPEQGDTGTCPESERKCVGRWQAQLPAQRSWPPHPSSQATGLLVVFSDLLCQDPSPQPGEEVNLTTTGKDTMSQRRRETRNN